MDILWFLLLVSFSLFALLLVPFCFIVIFAIRPFVKSWLDVRRAKRTAERERRVREEAAERERHARQEAAEQERRARQEWEAELKRKQEASQRRWKEIGAELQRKEAIERHKAIERREHPTEKQKRGTVRAVSSRYLGLLRALRSIQNDISPLQSCIVLTYEMKSHISDVDPLELLKSSILYDPGWYQDFLAKCEHNAYVAKELQSVIESLSGRSPTEWEEACKTAKMSFDEYCQIEGELCAAAMPSIVTEPTWSIRVVPEGTLKAYKVFDLPCQNEFIRDALIRRKAGLEAEQQRQKQARLEYERRRQEQARLEAEQRQREAEAEQRRREMELRRQEERAKREAKRRELMEAQWDRIDGMEGHDFEHYCAELLRANGFVDVEVTRDSNDDGVDIVAQKNGVRYAFQCKRYAKNVGKGAIQEVNTGLKVYDCDRGVVITNSKFTEGAKKLARTVGVELWNRDKLEQLIAAWRKTMK